MHRSPTFAAPLGGRARRLMRRRARRALRAAVASLLVGTGCVQAQEPAVSSPDGRTRVIVALTPGGEVTWRLQRDGEALVMPSRLGFALQGAPPLAEGLRITGTAERAVDETWEQPWGQLREVRDHYNELTVSVEEAAAPGRRFDLVFRVFDDGVGFRYDIPEQPGLAELVIAEELTEFAFADNARAWWIPSDRPRMDRSEMLYSQSPVSVLDSVQTPLTLETRDGGTVMVVHEADLVDYPRMFLAGAALEDRTLRAALAPMADGVKARGSTPFRTPWRTLQVADRVEDLVPSVLALNLNPPSRIDDTSWIEPMRYVGIWWGMHINTYTWGSGPDHGATTENTRRYIDFAAENGFGGVLVEGWNVGWDGDWVANSELFSFTEPYPDYDLPGLAAYARERGVDLIAHNETSGGLENYEAQLEDAYALYRSLGIRAIKSGYVADDVLDGDSHYSQPAVRHHRHVLETAARYGIMMNVHEPIHDTGERRTWPNMMTREGSRGQEYNAWSGDGGNPPEHETILFFTRLIPGPMDFTPGVLDILRATPDGDPPANHEPRIRTTLAKQLALYVVLWSPFQMAADLPENYEGHPALPFIRDVPVDWEETRVLTGRIGDHVVVARRERGGDAWYLGAITDEEARTFEIPLDFLGPGSWTAGIWADGPGADWKDNPLALDVREETVSAGSTLTIELAPGGGQAVRLRPAG
ncbi:MAG TPA: glycoside hydrolase family 97 protein [Longimicrobiales bacterium]|nr:glycoside hydrolase family 97 protein [Longimicrobiales bacterium]